MKGELVKKRNRIRPSREIKLTEKTLRQTIEDDLSDNLLIMFMSASEEEKIRIEEDVNNLIKENTLVDEYKNAPMEQRRTLLRQSIVFVLFGE
tara:strand:+ start:6214 stop:6492 length:279 start_codon:yes stop_codon:yes gene_type:complete